MKNNYKVRAKKFVKEIEPYIKNCHNQFQYEIAVALYNHTHHRKVQVASGACRVALITSDYVIKIDYHRDHISMFGGNYKEYCFYKKAKKLGFDYLLAECSRFIVNHKYYYVMPRINGIGNENKYPNWTDEESDFIDTYINDLHEWNYGYKNGRPIIIDYACNRED